MAEMSPSDRQHAALLEAWVVQMMVAVEVFSTHLEAVKKGERPLFAHPLGPADLQVAAMQLTTAFGGLRFVAHSALGPQADEIFLETRAQLQGPGPADAGVRRQEQEEQTPDHYPGKRGQA